MLSRSGVSLSVSRLLFAFYSSFSPQSSLFSSAALKEEGLVHSIGVSNIQVADLIRILAVAKVRRPFRLIPARQPAGTVPLLLPSGQPLQSTRLSFTLHPQGVRSFPRLPAKTRRRRFSLRLFRAHRSSWRKSRRDRRPGAFRGNKKATPELFS